MCFKLECRPGSAPPKCLRVPARIMRVRTMKKTSRKGPSQKRVVAPAESAGNDRFCCTKAIDEPFIAGTLLESSSSSPPVPTAKLTKATYVVIRRRAPSRNCRRSLQLAHYEALAADNMLWEFLFLAYLSRMLFCLL